LNPPTNIVTINALTFMLNIIGQCDVKHAMTSHINTITPVLNVRHTLLLIFTAQFFGLAFVQVIMHVSTFTKLLLFSL